MKSSQQNSPQVKTEFKQKCIKMVKIKHFQKNFLDIEDDFKGNIALINFFYKRYLNSAASGQRMNEKE